MDKELVRKLTMLGQRKLQTGERVLLAKVICDNIELPSKDVDSIGGYVITQSRFIDSVIYRVSDYSYIDAKEATQIKELVKHFMQWRFDIAYGRVDLLFVSGAENVVDELSGIKNYVDLAAMCAIGDIYNNTNHMYCMFKDFVCAVKQSV